MASDLAEEKEEQGHAAGVTTHEEPAVTQTGTIAVEVRILATAADPASLRSPNVVLCLIVERQRG